MMEMKLILFELWLCQMNKVTLIFNLMIQNVVQVTYGPYMGQSIYGIYVVQGSIWA